MTHSFIARKDLDSEMTVVRNEYEKGENDPMDVLFKRLLAAMYDWHSYGKETIGARSDIENVRIENLQSFYRTYYQPDNAVLIIAGHFELDRTLQLVVDTFGRIPSAEADPACAVDRGADPGRRAHGDRASQRRHPDRFGRLSHSAGRSTDAVALSAAADILGQTPSGRLHHELVRKRARGPGVRRPDVAARPGRGGVRRHREVRRLGRARGANRLIEVVEHSLVQTTPTRAEMDRMRRSAETEANARWPIPGFGVTLSDYIAQGDWRLFFCCATPRKRVEAADVAAATQRYLRRDNRTVAVFLPEDKPQRAEIPPPLSVQDMLKDFTPHATVEAGERFDPTPENIDARTKVVHAGDLKIALLPKKTKGATVNVAMAFHFGVCRL